MGELIRRTQFILTYGPGSIIESQDGPRLIPLPDIGLFHPRSGLQPERFEISDERIGKILNGGRVYRLPSNAELRQDESEPVYLTRLFPTWWVCQKHERLFRYEDGCPECDRKNEREWDAIRFVLACSRGHLDDVPWDYVVHRETRGKCPSGENPKYYIWRGGPALRDLKIECPKCGASITMQEVYNTRWSCSGRFPERETLGSPPVSHECDRRAVVVLRQASYLRIPEIISLFTLPPIYTRLHSIIKSTPALGGALLLNRPRDKNQLESLLLQLMEGGLIDERVVNEVLSYSWETIEKAFQDLFGKSGYERSKGNEKTFGWDELLEEEFRSLLKASVEGAPPYTLKTDASRVIFQVPKEGIMRSRGPSGMLFRIAPITKLRAVLIQKGYRRPVPGGTPEFVDVGFKDNQGFMWYPGVEHLGEGLFITLEGDIDLNRLGVGKEHWDAWLDAYRRKRNKYDDSLFRDSRSRKELHPAFVWWHTFSHLLMRVLSIDSGYSAASIRERVYLSLDDGKGGVKGGVILYTVQPGEGTMGGLVSLASYFEEILERVSELSETCPNDPLCFEQKFRPMRVHGAACYACSFVSETSCEHRNLWLDRHLLLEVPP